jgi:hypothetical protein
MKKFRVYTKCWGCVGFVWASDVLEALDVARQEFAGISGFRGLRVERG